VRDHKHYYKKILNSYVTIVYGVLSWLQCDTHYKNFELLDSFHKQPDP